MTSDKSRHPRLHEVSASINRRFRKPQSGQSLVIIALASLLLITLVGLAIDGGNTYNQRRKAQNGTDAAALASTRQMLTGYEQMVLANQDGDVNGSESDETALANTINSYAAENGIVTSTVKAYFVDYNRQIVSVTAHNPPSGSPCGTAPGLAPCRVGQNGAIPWVGGARGITVSGQSRSGSFIMGILGYTTDSATANATAYMGVAVTAQDVGLLPIGFYTTTTYWNQMVVGREYDLINSATTLLNGNQGWVNWNGNGSASVSIAWAYCGFNPSIRTNAAWANYCPAVPNQQGATGPTQYWVGWDEHSPTPTWPDGAPCSSCSFFPGPNTAYYVQFGPLDTGWWVRASSGATVSVCHALASNITSGKIINVPVFDSWYGTGTGAYYHLLSLGQFQITGDSNVDCNVPGGGTHWDIRGVYLQRFSSDSSGQAGDIRHTSQHVVYLAP